jgi:hypothetical protein
VIWAKRIGLMLLLSLLAFGIDYVMHKPAGDYCKSPSECRSRLCANGGYCTQRCRGDENCPTGFYCRESKVFTNKMESELAAQGVDLKGGTLEKLCLQ